MAKFIYEVNWSPYSNSLRAKNYEDAWSKLKKAYPDYKDVKKCIKYLTRQY